MNPRGRDLLDLLSGTRPRISAQGIDIAQANCLGGLLGREIEPDGNLPDARVGAISPAGRPRVERATVTSCQRHDENDGAREAFSATKMSHRVLLGPSYHAPFRKE